MNIQILDSWLKEHVATKATATQIAEKLSLTSVSIEKIHPMGKDFLYDIEITSNRPDLASVMGLAREAGAVLPQFGIPAVYKKPFFKNTLPTTIKDSLPFTLKTETDKIKRVCYIILEVTQKESPQEIQQRLEAGGIRSLNNLIDITNYVMRVTGHPTHVFDYDRLPEEKKLLLRESKKGEKITTLDKKTYELKGGDLVAESGGELVDLLGIMGLANSVVTPETKRIVFFIDNNDPVTMRRTSMQLGIRTEAVQLNEKGVDPELAMSALLYGLELYKKYADAKVLSQIVDYFPQPPKSKTLSISSEKINSVVGIEIPLKKAQTILTSLGFEVKSTEKELEVTVPSFRAEDVTIPEDIIEEIARVYGYSTLPSILPPLSLSTIVNKENNPFYFESQTKQAMKYWGYTEVYTYSMVSEEMFEGPLDIGVKIANPLSADWVYMRRTLVPSLLKVVEENKAADSISIFEISNVYLKNPGALPTETRHLAGVIKKQQASFFEIKGLVEEVGHNLGISDLTFKPLSKGGIGADVLLNKNKLGEIEVLDDNLINFELDFDLLISHATTKKKFTPLSKYPPIVEDMSLVTPEDTTTGEIIELIYKQSPLITEVTLMDKYQDTRTFHIIYKDPEKNLTTEDVEPIRLKITNKLKDALGINVK